MRLTIRAALKQPPNKESRFFSVTSLRAASFGLRWEAHIGRDVLNSLFALPAMQHRGPMWDICCARLRRPYWWLICC